MSNSLSQNIYFKLGVIIVIILLLLIPKIMIEQLIREREHRQHEAISEVSGKWGQAQTISGPILSIPYYEPGGTKKFAHFLPDRLNINGDISPESRHRGIFEIVVYDSKLRVDGHFAALHPEQLGVDVNRLMWTEAIVTLGISDLKGIEQQIELEWNDTLHQFNSGLVSTDVVSNGVTAFVALEPFTKGEFAFAFDLDLKGSQHLHFTPTGKVTSTNIHSTWSNPSFNGQFLPDTSHIHAQGFDASWNILHLNRNYPQSWTDSKFHIDNSAFGIDLILPVDNYQKSTRSIKYAILFLVLTFMVFFFIEVFNKRSMHPIQYLLVGIALIVFYTLLLSMSEYLPFNGAFLASTSATILLITLYVRAILKSNLLALMLAGILGVLYGFIFVVIQLQDYSLLFGSIGIFVILALVMWISRKIDWNNLG